MSRSRRLASWFSSQNIGRSAVAVVVVVVASHVESLVMPNHVPPVQARETPPLCTSTY